MRLYFHTDRAGSLRECDVIENRVYPNGNAVGVLCPVIGEEFAAHIQQMFSRGISYHGYNYLVSSLTGEKSFSSWAIEIYFEYIRFKHYPDKPSRFESFFCWETFDDAQDFARSENQRYSIYEVSNEGPYFITDMNLLKLDFNPVKQEENARKYWLGEPMDGDLSYKAKWEYLVSTSIKVIRRVI